MLSMQRQVTIFQDTTLYLFPTKIFWFDVLNYTQLNLRGKKVMVQPVALLF